MSIKRNTGSELVTLAGLGRGLDAGAAWLIKDRAQIKYTGGDITLNQTAVTNVHTSTDLVVAAAAGDIIEYTLSGRLAAASVTVGFDVYTLVSGSPVNSFGPGLSSTLAAAGGVPSWITYPITAVSLHGSYQYVVQAGDVVAGTVTLRLRYAVVSSTRTLAATANSPLTVTAMVFTPVVGSQFNLTQKINPQTGTTYTIATVDVGALIAANNASAITVTVPQDSAVTYPIGAYTDLKQVGVGQITVVAGTGATLVNPGPTAKSRTAGSRLGLQKTAANTWDLFGDLAAS